MVVKKKDRIGDVIKKYPEAAEIMFKSGLYCIGCPVAMMETIEDGAKSHGFSDEQIDKMIDEINKRIKK